MCRSPFAALPQNKGCIPQMQALSLTSHKRMWSKNRHSKPKRWKPRSPQQILDSIPRLPGHVAISPARLSQIKYYTTLKPHRDEEGDRVNNNHPDQDPSTARHQSALTAAPSVTGPNPRSHSGRLLPYQAPNATGRPQATAAVMSANRSAPSPIPQG